MHLDRFTYPYEPGIRGIAPKEFILPAEPKTTLFYGESGMRLKRDAHSRKLLFTEVRFNRDIAFQYRLEALLDSEGKLSLDLCTRSLDKSGKEVRHPDLFAGAFIDIVIAEIFKEKIASIEGVWYRRHSLNYPQYYIARYRGLNKMDSANATWTGRALDKHGFAVRDESDITFSGGTIRALFRKEPTFWQSLSQELRESLRQ